MDNKKVLRVGDIYIRPSVYVGKILSTCYEKI